MSRAIDYAFPLDTKGGPENGLTIREYFAAAALTGLCANPVTVKEAELSSGVQPQVARKALVDCAVKIADALIAELAEAKGQS